jgi:drug/metabolite transporter (DMT)-like permease
VRARLALLATAILFSTGGAAIKACSMSSWQVATFRSAFAVVALLLAVPSTRTRWTLPVLLVGASQAATMVLFVSSTKLTTAANAIFLQSTAPLYVLVLAPLVLREPVRRSDVAFLLAFLVGLCTIFLAEAPPTTTAPDPVTGNWLALASGVAWACTVMGFRWTAREGTSFGATLLAGNVIVAIVGLPMALPLGEPTVADWSIVAFLGVFQIALSYALLSIGMREVPALEASLLMLLEPALNPAWAWIVHGERVAPAALAGGGIVVATTVAKTAVDARRTRLSATAAGPAAARACAAGGTHATSPAARDRAGS